MTILFWKKDNREIFHITRAACASASQATWNRMRGKWTPNMVKEHSTTERYTIKNELHVQDCYEDKHKHKAEWLPVHLHVAEADSSQK